MHLYMFQLPLHEIYLGPECCEEHSKICPTDDSEEARGSLDRNLDIFRTKCRDWYVTATFQEQSRLPFDDPVLELARFADPSVALSSSARRELPDLNALANRFKVSMEKRYACFHMILWFIYTGPTFALGPAGTGCKRRGNTMAYIADDCSIKPQTLRESSCHATTGRVV